MRTCSLALCALTLGQSAFAQCDQWLPTPGSSELSYTANLCAVDHDGPGPERPRLYASGILEGPTSSRFCRWANARWNPIPGFDNANYARALVAMEQPAAGLPSGTLLYGSSVSASIAAARFFCAFDGQTITPLGPTDAASYSASAAIHAITTWDPDGPGPQPALIVVGGSFTRIGGINTTHVAAWNGTQWLALGTGRPAAISAVVSYDPDDDGPALPLLIAGDSAWNGSTWQRLGDGLNNTVNALATHDADGDGPLLPELYAAGPFTASGTTSTPRIAKWSGAAWISGGAVNATFGNNIRSIDLDGPGPQLPQLVFTGTVGSGPIAILTNGAWVSPPGATVVSSSGGSTAITAIDPDDDGPRGIEIVAGGNISRIGVSPYVGPATWNGQRWSALGDDILGGQIYAFAWHDDDGPLGPLPNQLYASGAFTFAGGHPCDGLARWDGQRWVGLGTPTSPTPRKVSRLVSYDPDGNGPQPSWLAGINVAVNPVLPIAMRWDGSAWVSIDSLFSASQVFGLCAMDDDGLGPHITRLFIGGSQTSHGSVAVFGSGPRFSTVNAPNSTCFTLFSHDTDGAGPADPALYGLFQNQPYLARWSGSSWSNLPNAFTVDNWPNIPQATSWDPDGAGATPPEIVIAGSNFGLGPVAHDGTNGRQLGSSFQLNTVRTIGAFDPDGQGPAAPQLLVGYTEGDHKGIRRLVGQTWTTLGEGLDNTLNISEIFPFASAFITIDPDANGPLPPELWIGGNFTHAGGQPASNFARWRPTGSPPLITSQPAPATPCSNTPATLTVIADAQNLAYQWRISDAASNLRWRTITDGPVTIAGVQVGIAQGSQSPTLTFTPSANVTASFTCIVSSQCDATISRPASLQSIACCSTADFNNDSDSGTDADIEAFFACLAGNCCPTCWHLGADFNADGDTGTDADIEAFFRVLAGGNC